MKSLLSCRTKEGVNKVKEAKIQNVVRMHNWGVKGGTNFVLGTYTKVKSPQGRKTHVMPA